MTLHQAILDLVLAMSAFLGAYLGKRTSVAQLRILLEDAINLHAQACARLRRELARTNTGETSAVAPVHYGSE